MTTRDDEDLAVDIGIERNGHYDTIFFMEDVFVAHVAETAFADSLPNIVIFTSDSGVAIHDLFFGCGELFVFGCGHGLFLEWLFAILHIVL